MKLKVTVNGVAYDIDVEVEEQEEVGRISILSIHILQHELRIRHSFPN